ncbi:MAG: phosphoglycerate mutase family protein, partial [Candidatus Eisenbacteria bacterium]
MRILFSLLVVCASLFGGVASSADAPSRPATVAGKGVRTVYLIRHGFYEPDSTADPRLGPGLNTLGRQQAVIVGGYLASLPVKFNSLTSSTLTRARQSADWMAPAMHMKVARDSLLSECTPRSANPGLNSSQNDAEIGQCDTQLQAAWAKYMRPSPEADT